MKKKKTIITLLVELLIIVILVVKSGVIRTDKQLVTSNEVDILLEDEYFLKSQVDETKEFYNLFTIEDLRVIPSYRYSGGRYFVKDYTEILVYSDYSQRLIKKLCVDIITIGSQEYLSIYLKHNKYISRRNYYPIIDDTNENPQFALSGDFVEKYVLDDRINSKNEFIPNQYIFIEIVGPSKDQVEVSLVNGTYSLDGLNIFITNEIKSFQLTLKLDEISKTYDVF